MMEPLATALMILLQCSPNALECREVQLPNVYASIDDCREALPRAVKRLSSERAQVVGRCTLATDAVTPGVDPIITGSAAPDSSTREGHALVLVTRLGGGAPVTRVYEVPRGAR